MESGSSATIKGSGNAGDELRQDLFCSLSADVLENDRRLDYSAA